jgi:signal transduction histidine kinase
LFALLYISGSSQTKMPEIDSLERLLESKTDSARVHIMLVIGSEYEHSDLKSAESFFRKALSLSDSLNYLEGKARSLKHLADLKIATSEYKEAYNYVSSAMEYFKTLADMEGVASCYLSLSFINNRIADYPKALEQASNSLILYRKAGSLDGMALAYNNLGNIYDNMSNYKQSLRYYHKALEIHSSANNKIGLARVYINLSIIYNKTNKPGEAEELLNKAIEIGEETKDKRLLAIAYGNMGLMRENAGNYPDALEYYKLSLELKTELEDRHSIMISEINIGNTYLKMNQTDQALQHINKAVEIGNLLNAKRELIDAYSIQAQLYERRGNFSNAYAALKMKTALNDSIFGTAQLKHMADVDRKNEINQLESENQILRQKSIIDQLKLENNRFIRYYLLIGLSFAIVLIGLLIYQSGERRKSARRLDEVNKQLIKTNKQLKRSESALAESNHAKDKFFSIISHDLRNPLASMVSFVRIMKRDYATLEQHERDALIEEFEKIVNRTGNLLENLLMWSRSQTGRLNITPEKFKARNILDENAELHETLLRTKKIRISIEVENDNTEVFADKNMISTVVRNLLSNSIKFTPAGGKIELGFKHSGKNCVFHIKDSGIGINADKIPSLFSLGEVYVRTGTANEKGSGLGLVLCKEFVEKNHGEIWLESKTGEGTTFYFSVPLFS